MEELPADNAGVRSFRVKCDCGYLSVMGISQFRRSQSCYDCTKQSKWEVGMKVGTRTITRMMELHRNGWRHCETKCDCGRIDKTDIGSLQKSKTCAQCAGAGRVRVHQVVPGTRYGNRTTIAEEGYIGPHRAVRVVCDCGTESVVPFYSLRYNRIMSCIPCYRKRRLT